MSDNLGDRDLKSLNEEIEDLSSNQLKKLGERMDEKDLDELNKGYKLKRKVKLTYEGPIPHPSLLSQFNEVIPNGADRIMKMAENESEHRQSLEKKQVDAYIRDSKLGIIFAGMIGVIAVVGAIFLIAIDKTIQGFLLGGGALASLVGIYLKGTNLDNSNTTEDEKRKSDEDSDIE